LKRPVSQHRICIPCRRHDGPKELNKASLRVLESAVCLPLTLADTEEEHAVSISASAQARAKRRVPEDLRKRVEVSCDRCKKRKTKCIRLEGIERSCAACYAARQPCEATLPRKQRIYGSIESLDARSRLVHAIVRRLLPGRDVDDEESLRQLAHEYGVTDDELEPIGSSRPGESSTNPSRTDYGGDGVHGRDRPSDSDIELTCIPEGGLIPAPRGGYHYVGPASSFLFANTVRRLVSKSSLPAFDDASFRRYLRAIEFTSFRTSQALEARIQGHPASAAADEELPPAEVGGLTDPFLGAYSSYVSPADWPTPRSVLDARSSRELLPRRDVSDTAIAAFFDRVHPNFVVFNRDHFRARYDAVWAPTSSAMATQGDIGWTCALLLSVALGAQALESSNPNASEGASLVQSRCVSPVIRQGFQRLSLTASLPNTQALLLLSLYQHNAGERNTAWMVLGQAARMSVALGMHRDGEHAGFDPVERNTRRMVWWTLHMFEQTLSLALGRPSVTDIRDITTRLPDEAADGGDDYPSGYLAQSVLLTSLATSVRRIVAAVSSDYDKPDFLMKRIAISEDLSCQLSNWRAALPPHLCPGFPFVNRQHRRVVLFLHATYHHIRSVLDRPFLLCWTNHLIDSATVANTKLNDRLVLRAMNAGHDAKEVLRLICQLAVWLDFYYVHHAVLIVGLRFLVVSETPEADDRATVRAALSLARDAQLAPTYRILVNIARQFALVTGIDTEELAEEAALDIPPSIAPAGSADPYATAAIGVTSRSSPAPPFADMYSFGLHRAGHDDFWNFFDVSLGKGEDERPVVQQASGDTVLDGLLGL
jgi:proline utilization trans-activator